MTHSRLGIARVFALVCAVGCALPATARAGEIIVRRDAGLSPTERADIRADAGVEHERMLPAVANAELVNVPAGGEARALAALNVDPDVRYAEPVVRFRVATNDLHYDKLWGLENVGQVIQRQPGIEDADMDVPEAWAVTRGAGQTVAVIDSGIQLTHPDFVGRIAPGGRSFVAGVTSFNDDSGHGTTVAGVIAANADNGIGVAGVAPAASLLPLKAVASDNSADSLALGAALDYAGDVGVRVANLSVGGPRDSQFVRDAIAAHPQTLYVVAAGNGDWYGNPGLGDDNDGTGTGDSGPDYPCNFPLANLICVGATNNLDEVAIWSNYGATSVDLFAPGESVFTTRRFSAYGPESGTSLSAPMIAAEAALMLAAHPNLNGSSLRRLLLRAVDPIAGAARHSVTGGRANAGTLVTGPVPDLDGDGAIDELDICPSAADPVQADADADGIGDVCDPMPRGDDVDGDTKPALDDACPFVPSAEPNGCPPIIVNPPGGPGGQPPSPTPTPTPGPLASPRVATLGVSLTPKKCPGGRSGCRKSAKVTVKLTRSATVSLKLEQRTTRKGRTVWKRITTKSLKATTSARSLTLKRLKRGSYRVTATVSGKGKSRSFRV